jgi:hypothetical protein
MRRPLGDDDESFRRVSSRRNSNVVSVLHKYRWTIWDDKTSTSLAFNYHEHRVSQDLTQTAVNNNDRLQQIYYAPAVLKAFENVCFIAELLKKKDRDDKVDFVYFSGIILEDPWLSINWIA